MKLWFWWKCNQLCPLSTCLQLNSFNRKLDTHRTLSKNMTCLIFDGHTSWIGAVKCLMTLTVRPLSHRRRSLRLEHSFSMTLLCCSGCYHETNGGEPSCAAWSVIVIVWEIYFSFWCTWNRVCVATRSNSHVLSSAAPWSNRTDFNRLWDNFPHQTELNC